MDESLRAFIRDAAAQGESMDQIKQQLVAKGWEPGVVSGAILQYQQEHPVFVQPIVKNFQEPTSTERSSSKPIRISFLLFFVLIGIGIGAFFLIRSRLTPVAVTDLQSTQALLTPAPTESTFSAYINPEFAFEIHIPKTWATKEFPTGAFGQEKRIAFGLVENLPQDIFIDNDYIWIKIFPTSDSSNYNDFMYIKSLSGEDTVKEITVQGMPAYLTSDFIVLEHNGLVYELHLLSNSETREPIGPIGINKTIFDSFRLTK